MLKNDKPVTGTAEATDKPALTDEEKRIGGFKDYFECGKFWIEKGLNRPSQSHYPIESCTFLGKTAVDKVQVAKSVLQTLGFVEYGGKGEGRNAGGGVTLSLLIRKPKLSVAV
jgi:hypothetical protein